MPRSASRLALSLLLFSVAMLVSCQSSEFPTLSPSSTVAQPSRTDPAQVPLAAFGLTIDVASGTAELDVVRTGGAIGDTYSEVGLMPAFDGRFGDHFDVDGVRRIDPETLAVDFTTSHPFTAAVRPDLAIFNLKLWAVIDAPGVDINGVQAVPGIIRNADGYGNMWATTATQLPAGPPHQPYIILNEDPTSLPFDWHAPAGWNVLFPGQSTQDTLEVRPGVAEVLRFRLLLTADYGQSAVRATRQNPQYSLPEFAGNAPWKIQVTELVNDLQGGVASSSADYQVDIWDWKHGQSLGSDVIAATLAVPDLLGPTPLTLALSGTGTDPTPLTAIAVVPNFLGAAEGTYWGAVTATDAASGVAIQDDLVTLESVGAYQTYQLFAVEVGEALPPVDPPTAVIARACPGLPLGQGDMESFDATGSLPGAAAIVEYEWDFNYIAPTFDIEATGSIVSQPFATPGTYTVALRVRDADLVEDLATTLVTVLPTAQWGPAIRLTTTPGEKELFDINQNTSNALSIGPDGKVHLAYYTFLPYVVYHRTFQPSAPPVTWTAAEVIHSSGGGGAGHVSCQTTADNVTHIAYTANTVGNPQMYRNNSGGTWSAPMQIPSSTDPGRWERTLLVAGAANEVAFLGQWGRADQPAVGSGLPALPNNMLFTKITAGVWETLTNIGDAHVITSEGGGGRVPSHALVGTADGEWVTVWESLYTPFLGGPTGVPSRCKLIWSETAAGTWPADGTDLYFDDVDYDLPVLARSPNGRIWLGARTSETDVFSMSTYENNVWSPSMTQVFAPTGVTFSRLPLAQISFDALGRGSVIVSYREPTAPVQAKFFSQDDLPATLGSCAVQVVEPGGVGVGRPMCQIAPHGDGRFTAIWLTTEYDGGNPYFANTEIEYATYD